MYDEFRKIKQFSDIFKEMFSPGFFFNFNKDDIFDM